MVKKRKRINMQISSKADSIRTCNTCAAVSTSTEPRKISAEHTKYIIDESGKRLPSNVHSLAPLTLSSISDTIDATSMTRSFIPSTVNSRQNESDKNSERKVSQSFRDLGLPSFIIQRCSLLGISVPTYVQQITIPLILSKLNLVAFSETGSGKTACYVWPIVHFLSQDSFGLFAIVLIPSRELATQISEHFDIYGSALNIRVLTCTGGMDITTQSIAISSKPHVIIATPGRLCNLIEQDEKEFCMIFKFLEILILDEADSLMQYSFVCDLKKILAVLPPSKKRQTLMFTATPFDISIIPHGISDVEFRIVDALRGSFVPESVCQYYLFIPKIVKVTYVYHLVQKRFNKDQGIIFVPTCWLCQEIATTLQLLDVSCTSLHSLLDQRRRIASLAKFRSEVSRILVCTDLASRGLDIPKVSFIINFCVPSKYETYVHRIGRTGRAHRKGLSITFISFKSDVPKLHHIEEMMNKKLELFKTDEDEVLKDISSVSKSTQQAILILNRIGFDKKVKAAREEKMACRKMFSN